MLQHLKADIPLTVRRKIELALQGFCDRTLSSDSISDSEKVRRLDISNDAIKQIRDTRWFIRFLSLRQDVPQTVEMVHTLARWFNDEQDDVSQDIVARILVNVRERNDSWFTLAARTFGLPERDLRDNIALGDDSVLLAILNHVTRQFRRSIYSNWTILRALSKLDMRNTHPRLQLDFCALWNEFVQEARDRGSYTHPVYILNLIRRPYIALHQGTDAAPTAFSASTDDGDDILLQPSSYPFCELASHRPDSTAHVSVTLPKLPRNSAPPQDITSTITLSRYPENLDIVAPGAEPSTSQILSTSSTHTPALTPTPAPISASLLNTPSESYHAVVVSVPDLSHCASPSVGSSIPSSHSERLADERRA
jgi:hypothetical protein